MNFRSAVNWQDNTYQSGYYTQPQQSQAAPASNNTGSTYNSSYQSWVVPGNTSYQQIGNQQVPYYTSQPANTYAQQPARGNSYDNQEYNPEYPSFNSNYNQQNQTQGQYTYTPSLVNTSAFGDRNRKVGRNPARISRQNFSSNSRTSKPAGLSSAAGAGFPRKLNKASPIAKRSNLKPVAAAKVTTTPQPKTVTKVSNTNKKVAAPKPAKPTIDSKPSIPAATISAAPSVPESENRSVKTDRSSAKTRGSKQSKFARGRGAGNQSRGGVAKRYRQGNMSGTPAQAAWNTGNRPFRGRGRGGRGRGRGPRGPTNNQTDIPFVPLTDSDEQISLALDVDNMMCFHGFQSIFTTQHNFPLLIDGKIYESGDHYYQIQKVNDLCGTISDKLMETVRDENGRRLDGGTGFRSSEEKGFSQLAKELLKLNNVEKSKVDEWRYTKGLEYIQRSLSAKVSQSAHMREAMKETNDKILVHAYIGDSIYGAGAKVPAIKAWVEEMKGKGVNKLNIPAMFPMDNDSVAKCPNFAQGRNVLGVILMQLRKKLAEGDIVIMDMSHVFDNLRNNKAEAMEDDSAEGFAIGGGNLQEKLGATKI